MNPDCTIHLPDDPRHLLADLRDAHHRTQNAAIGDLVAQIEAQELARRRYESGEE